MRWLFALLVLTNVAFFFWGIWFKPDALPPPKPARAAVNAEKIRLLSEPGVIVEPRAAPAPDAAAPTPLAAGEARPLCYTIGPFTRAEDMSAVGTRLQELGLSYLERQQEKREPAGFRVLLEPFANARAAENKRQELTRAGIKDHGVINEPGRRPGISLGIFSLAENAQNYARHLARKGVKAKVESLTKTTITQWLDTHALAPEAAAAVQRSFAEVKGLEVNEKICPVEAETADR